MLKKAAALALVIGASTWYYQYVTSDLYRECTLAYKNTEYMVHAVRSNVSDEVILEIAAGNGMGKSTAQFALAMIQFEQGVINGPREGHTFPQSTWPDKIFDACMSQ